MVAESLTWKLDEGRNNLYLTLVFTIFPAIISSLFVSISNYVSFAGCFSGSVICFLFPGLLAIKINYFKDRTNIFKVFLGIFMGIMMICTVFAFKKFLDINN